MKNFLFYVGNARAGSTWLYGELNARGDCDFGEIKENFYFVDGFTLSPELSKKDYFSRYRSLAENDDIILLGDMTPSNALATKEELYRYNEEMLRNGLKCLPVMTLRDPLSIAISQTKMNHAMITQMRQANAFSLREWVGGSNRSVEEIRGEHVLKNGNPPFLDKMVSWQTTAENCREVFGSIHFNLFEIMFSEGEMRKLTDYLDIPYEDMNFSTKRFNIDCDNVNITDGEKQKIYNTFPFSKENYQFAVDVFGKGLIESVWWNPNK